MQFASDTRYIVPKLVNVFIYHNYSDCDGKYGGEKVWMYMYEWMEFRQINQAILSSDIETLLAQDDYCYAWMFLWNLSLFKTQYEYRLCDMEWILLCSSGYNSSSVGHRIDLKI